MIKCWVELGDGSALMLPTAVQWKFSYGTGLPCDSFYIRCLWESGREKELSAAALFYAQWNGERVFTGVVDEFSCVCGSGGLYLELSGRGMAARLLDNEALPAEYQRVTCADIIADHVTPFGVIAVGGKSLPEVSGFSVSSGVSEWSVVENYACYYGGVVPRFDRLGRLILDPHPDDEIVKIDANTPITEWEYREQRHGVLSRVAVRQRSSWDTYWVENKEFLAQGGCARRVITVPNETKDVAMRYSAEYQLKASQSERVRLSLTMAGVFLAWSGQLVEVSRNGFGGNGQYRVAQTEVVCDDGGFSTTMILGEPDSMI